MAEEPTALRLHSNQSFQDQLGHAVHPSKAQTMAHLTQYRCWRFRLNQEKRQWKVGLPRRICEPL
eukprot:scaffold8532_cov65-Attheya_sp.AAC.3